MCDRLVILARHDHRRWISCCEHGTTHLSWDNVSLRIPLEKLGAMSQALHECGQVARQFRIASTGDVCVVFDQHDLYQVWLGGVGLCLAPEDFGFLQQIVDEASKHPMACSNCSQPTRPSPYADAPIRTTFHLFSLN